MKSMKGYAKEFQTKHVGNGVVSKVTNYSFKYVENQKMKDGQPKVCVYMLSYFF